MSLINELNIDDSMLLYGEPILIPTTQITIAPIRLKEIGKIGINNFYTYLNILTFDSDSVIEDKETFKDIPKNEKDFLFFIMMCKENKSFRNTVTKALKFFIKKEVLFIEDFNMFNFILKGNDGVDTIIPLDLNIFEVLQYIIKKQNFIFPKEEEFKPNSSKAAEIIEKTKKGRKKLMDIKNKNSNVSLGDLIASLAAKGNGLNILSIWNINYYAFNDQLQRLKMIEEYDMGLKSILAGADSKKVKLEYWIRDIQTK